jgi:hypothetical protein
VFINHRPTVLGWQHQVVYQDGYVMTFVNISAHPIILRRKRRGIQPVEIQVQSVTKRQPKNTGQVVVINPELNPAIGKYLSMIPGMIQQILPGKDKVHRVARYEAACECLKLPYRSLADN